MQNFYRCRIRLITFAAGLSLYCGAASAQAIDWTRFYAGAQVGYSWDNLGVATDTPLASVHFNDSSGIGGVQGGKNIVQQGAFVAGVVADFNWLKVGAGSSASQSSTSTIDICGDDCFVSTTTNTQYSVNLDLVWKASLRAKAGVLAAPNVLLYATGGVAFARLKAEATQTTTTTAPPSTTTDSMSDQANLIGYVIGGGAEMMITPNIGVFSQVLYYGFEDKNFQFLGSNIDVSLNETVAEVGVSYYFN